MPEDRVEQRPRHVWQVGTRTLILVVALVAVWFAVWVNRNQIALLETRIRSVSALARELVVEDPAKIAVVKRQETWYDDNQWDLHLPPGSYQLCLATRGIDQDGWPAITKRVPIEAGRHRIALGQRSPDPDWRVVVSVDGEEVIVVEEPTDWDQSFGSTGGGRHSSSTQVPKQEPLLLFRRRFVQRDSSGRSGTPTGPANGVVLWIEATTEPPASNR